jgi:hypothetical protein
VVTGEELMYVPSRSEQPGLLVVVQRPIANGTNPLTSISLPFISAVTYDDD